MITGVLKEKIYSHSYKNKAISWKSMEIKVKMTF